MSDCDNCIHTFYNENEWYCLLGNRPRKECEDYRHWNGLTANEWLIESQERELEKKNEQISDLREENEQLKQQLLYDGDDVCDICKHEYLVPRNNYFISKCEKGHEECSTEDIQYCEDFELKELLE